MQVTGALALTPVLATWLAFAGAFGATAVTSVATPPPLHVSCAQPRAPSRRATTPDARLSAILDRAASRLNVAFQPSSDPYGFLLHVSRDWVAGTPLVALEAPAVDVKLDDAAGHQIERARSLGPAPLPARLYNPCFDDHGVTYRFAIAPPPGAGMYTLRISARAKPQTLPDGNRVVASAAVPIAMYVPSPPAHAPALRVGQPYLVLPAIGASYVDTAGAIVPWNRIAMRVARIDRIDGALVTLHVDGTPYRLREERSGSSAMLAGLVALVDDSSQRAMNAWYAGKRVWMRGGLGATCSLQPNAFRGYGAAHAPVIRVLHVYRVDVPFMEMGIGSEMETIGGSRESAFETSAPLLVTLSVSGTPTAFGGYSNGVAAPAGSASWGCGTSYTYFSGAWDLQRAFSTVSAREAHPTWPPAMLTDIEAGRLADGMTHEMVAWAIGYPSIYAAPQELNRMADWRYDDLPPFNYWVHFDRAGRVKSFGADGHLP